ncbi:MAG: hypothetical protein A4E53_04138 [Pelotomaculum sp. PtaB.Bin104]|nr:MAG: hypothetical protein A4E53_04138 [Pelotomaculum sp. PtaB.Bin104]
MPYKLDKKELPVPGIIFLLVLLLLLMTPASKNILALGQEEAFLAELIKSSGAELNEANITGWVKVEPKTITGQPLDPAEIVPETVKNMGLRLNDQKLESWENAYAGGTKFTGTLTDGCVLTVLGQVMYFPGELKNMHIMINMAAADQSRTVQYKKLLDRSLARYGGDAHVAVTLTGKIDQEWNDDELAARAEKILHEAGAVVKEKTIKDNLVSLTGYCTYISDSIQYDGKEVNLNVALRRSAAEHSTMVYVASPVILTEY